MQSHSAAGDADFGVTIESDVMVPMRDGVRLATDIHRPARAGKPLPGPFPVVVERTPYDKAGTQLSERSAADSTPIDRSQMAAYFVKRGYVVVLQDCRGRYRSEGEFTKYIGEGEDGYDLLTWIMAQPWCDGRIGSFGMSYAAHAQTAMAALRPPGLTAMLLDSGGFSNAFRGGIRHGGAFELKQATWAYKHALLSPRAQADPVLRAGLEAEDIRDWFLAMPWRRGHSPLRHSPEYETYLFDQWERGCFDDYWRQPALWGANHYDALDGIPTLLICGWYDPYVQTTAENYKGIASLPNGTAKMVYGPWTHGQRSVTHAGDVDFGGDAPLDGQVAENYLAFRLDWFDRWLKPDGRGAADMPALRYFRMGGGDGGSTADKRLRHGGSWREAADWPVPDTDFRKYYFHGDGGLRTVAPTDAETALSFDFDPANPVPTIGGAITSLLPLATAGAYDQRTHSRIFSATPPYLPLQARGDILVFQTDPLEEPLEITGPIVVRLWVSSDGPDTDFTAKLIDWHPPNESFPQGYAMNLTDGIMRCRYRDSWERETFLTPGEAVEIVIEPMPTSNLFARGHRIRVDISSSNFPRFDVNSNTGEPEGQARRRRIAVNTVYANRIQPSHIVLPVIPATG